MRKLAELKEKAGAYLSEGELSLLERAFEFAAERVGGDEIALKFGLETALVLAELDLDAGSLAAGLLSGLWGKELEISEVRERLGEEISELVARAAKLRGLKLRAETPAERKAQAESLRRMCLVMADDMRIVLLKLAEILAILRDPGGLPPRITRQTAQEALDIYAPLAHRLGIFKLQSQLQDRAFKLLRPKEYRKIKDYVDSQMKGREDLLSRACSILREELSRAGIKAEVSGRPKSIFSIYTKLQKYAACGKGLEDIHDIFAVRIIVDEMKDCYSALGVVHSLWRPLPDQFDDYIANPKPNGYQSLHTTVLVPEGRPLEIQIRTWKMHEIAEFGIAAHWRYKEGFDMKSAKVEERFAWLRKLLEWQQALGEVRTDEIFRDRVFVYTPKGEIKELPAGATPVDFAYLIHTELGHRCIGAKVNGRLVPLNYVLQNGDMVEIITSKREKGPRLDWLNPDLGYVRTSHARAKIKQWFRRREREEGIRRGRELLQKELRRLNVNLSEEEAAQLFGYHDLGEFLFALGCGEEDVHELGARLAAKAEEEAPPAHERAQRGALDVEGMKSMLVHLASCCRPVPGDEIVGFVTRTRGISIHRRDCPNILNCNEKERLIPLTWSARPSSSYPVDIRIEARDRIGLLQDISSIIAKEKINIVSVRTSNPESGMIAFHLTLEVRDLGQLGRLFSKLEGVKGVKEVARAGAAHAARAGGDQEAG